MDILWNDWIRQNTTHPNAPYVEKNAAMYTPTGRQERLSDAINAFAKKTHTTGKNVSDPEPKTITKAKPKYIEKNCLDLMVAIIEKARFDYKKNYKMLKHKNKLSCQRINWCRRNLVEIEMFFEMFCPKYKDEIIEQLKEEVNSAD